MFLRAALYAISKIEKRGELENYYLFPATIGDLLCKKFECDKAIIYYRKALELTASPAQKKLLEKR